MCTVPNEVVAYSQGVRLPGLETVALESRGTSRVILTNAETTEDPLSKTETISGKKFITVRKN